MMCWPLQVSCAGGCMMRSLGMCTSGATSKGHLLLLALCMSAEAAYLHMQGLMRSTHFLAKLKLQWSPVAGLRHCTLVCPWLRHGAFPQDSPSSQQLSKGEVLCWCLALRVDGPGASAFAKSCTIQHVRATISSKAAHMHDLSHAD